MAQRQSVSELRQADEDDGEEGFAVPVVVGEDVQVVEHVLVEQVGFVEEEDGVDASGAELVDVLADLVEARRRRGTRAQAQRQAELAIEVATSERSVVAVGETESGFRESLS